MAASGNWNLKKTVVLVGMMGAGKTAIGQALAAQLSVSFLDSDAEIEKAANMTIAEIFERDGEAFFRDRETEVIDRLLECERGILSTGGGAFLLERNRELIHRKGVSLWLDADFRTLWNRVKHKDTRPLLRTASPKETLRELYEQRVPIYRLADLSVAAKAEYAIDEMTGHVMQTLMSRNDILESAK